MGYEGTSSRIAWQLPHHKPRAPRVRTNTHTHTHDGTHTNTHTTVLAGRGTCQATLRGHSAGVWCLCFISRNLLASGGSDGDVCLWGPASDAASLERSHQHRAVAAATATLAVPATTAVASSGLSQWALQQVLRGHSAGVLSVCRLSETLLASGSADCGICSWSLSVEARTQPKRKQQWHQRQHQQHSGAVCWLCRLDSGLLVSGSDDGLVKLWA